MKKLVLTVVAALAVSVAFTSCDQKKLEEALNAAIDSAATEPVDSINSTIQEVADSMAVVADSAAADSVAE